MARRPSVFSRFRLAAVLVIVGVGLAGAAFYALLNAHFLGAIIGRTLGAYSDTLSEHIFANPEPEVLQQIARTHRVAIVFEPAHGDPLAFDSLGAATTLALSTRGRLRATRKAPDGSRVTLYWRLGSFWHGHALQVLVLFLMVGMVIGSALWFLQRQLRPLAELQDGVEAVARGHFDTHVPVVRNDEIGRVASAFNEMTARVGGMVEDRERLLADVSHELRSPLARMKVALELMPASDKREAIVHDVREMEQLTSALLEREALRSRVGKLATETVDLAALLRDVVATIGARAPGIELGCGGEVSLQADPALLRMLAHNLIDNALKFSRPESGPVTVRCEDETEQVLLHVCDDGIGIPASEATRVLEPFVKLDRARGHRTGHGLGLNLCQRIVQLHGGTIRLLPREPRGTEVVVELPRRTVV